MLDQPHRSKCAAVEVTANRRTVLIDGAALLAEVDAGPIGTLSEHQLTITAPLREQVGQASAIPLLVYRNSGVVTASGARAARHRPRFAAPPGVEKIASSAVHYALRLIQVKSPM